MRKWSDYLNTIMVRQAIQCIAMRLGQAIQYGALRANHNSGHADIKWSKTKNVLLVEKAHSQAKKLMLIYLRKFKVAVKPGTVAAK